MILGTVLLGKGDGVITYYPMYYPMLWSGINFVEVPTVGCKLCSPGAGVTG